MTSWTLIRRSLRHYWRTHIGVILGAALGSMVLTGALLVGDSVKQTLRRQALDRVGRADSAMSGGDRFFRAALADASGSAPVLMLRATIGRADGKARVNTAQLLGVDQRFWKLSPSAQEVELPADSVALNARLAGELKASVGDTVIVRVEKPGAFSRDAPLSGEESDAVALRMKVARIVADADYGRFALVASQTPPSTLYAPLTTLQNKLGLADKANLLLQAGHGADAGFRDAIASNWQLPDLSLELRDLPNNTGLELRTNRVFLEPKIAEAAPRGPQDRRVDALTYFVNELRSGDRATPYSMVTAVETASSGFLPAELADDEIVISQWLADDLGIATGARVTLKYYVMGERRQLTEKSRDFTVLAVLPMDEPQLNTSWMPDFPGLADKKNCRDWKPGFDFDATRMRDKDQQYWEQYRGTPKAFVNLKVGQEMWANRWGNLTSLRWPAGADRAAIERGLHANLTPEQLGFQFLPLREQALAATKAPVDFGELFLSFSFFLLVAAAVLTGLLFVFALEQRTEEAGLLLAMGLPPKKVRRWFLAEGAVLALIGSVLGLIGAVLYTRLVLRALETVWSGAVGGVHFETGANPQTWITGVASSVLIALFAMWLTSRRQLRHHARELLASGGEFALAKAGPKGGRRSWALLVGAMCLIAAVATLLTARSGGAEAFFSAGGLLLIAGLAFAFAWLRRVSRASGGLDSLRQLGQRNAARRRGRSVATIAVLASGVFMVVAVDAFRKSPQQERGGRDSGTGGFALIAESALPIYEDLNTAKGREQFALDDATMHGVSVVPMRVREGDDASCLNLNRALQPRLLGVRPADLKDRGAFRFSAVLKEAGTPADGWSVLDRTGADSGNGSSAVDGVVDQATLQWALQKKLGDTLDYTDDSGRPFKVRLVGALAGSMLQGNVLISERRFIERFPNQGGYRAFLIDAPADRADAVAQELSRALADRGLAVVPAARRLADFHEVENTYLSIFQALGGLGLLLGSAGLAIVVARNVLERRREFGVLQALGFRSHQLRRLVFAEHRWLLVCGLGIGVVSALVAVWPNLREQAGGFPLRQMALLVLALAAGALFWIWIATRAALRGQQVDALRSE